MTCMPQLKRRRNQNPFIFYPFLFLLKSLVLPSWKAMLLTAWTSIHSFKPLKFWHGPFTMNRSFYLSLYFSTIGISVGPETILTNSKIISENSLLRRKHLLVSINKKSRKTSCLTKTMHMLCALLRCHALNVIATWSSLTNTIQKTQTYFPNLYISSMQRNDNRSLT